ncbi:MAG: dUTP diphosphatase [Candidatus Eisenbacteria bacterium]
MGLLSDGGSGASEPRRVGVARLRPGARLPRRMTDGASGFDLAACLEDPIEIEPGSWSLVPSGIALELPIGWEAQVRPRSGLAARHGVGILNGPGTIDSDYRGEVCVLLMNWGKERFVVRDGDRIAQIVFAEVKTVLVDWAERIEPTRRGAGGFGHTGTGEPQQQERAVSPEPDDPGRQPDPERRPTVPGEGGDPR